MHSALASYAFLNAKLKTRVSALLPQESIDALVRAKSLPETILLLRGTRFEGVEPLYASTGDLQSGEAALRSQDEKMFTELLRYAKGPVRDFFTALSLRSEVDRLKTVLRLWFDATTRGGDVMGKAAYIDRAPLVNKFDIDAMLAASNADELLAAMAGTPYPALIGNLLSEALDRGSLFSLELALDRHYFDQAFAAAKKLDRRDRGIAERALSMDADAQNADRLVRFKTYFGMGTEEALQCLIPHGAAAKTRGLAEAYSQEGSAEIAKRAFGSALGKIASFVGAAGEGKSATGLMEKAFRAIALDEARRLLGGFPFSIGIPLAYATLRRDEIRSIMTILNAKYYGLSEERIRNAL